MVANTLPADPRAQFQGVASAQLRGGGGVRIQLFQNMVTLHMKLKEITNAATW